MEENQGNKIAEPSIFEDKREIELTDTTEKNEIIEKQETAKKDLSAVEKKENIIQMELEPTETKENNVENKEENEMKKLILSYDTEDNREICNYFLLNNNFKFYYRLFFFSNFYFIQIF